MTCWWLGSSLRHDESITGSQALIGRWVPSSLTKHGTRWAVVYVRNGCPTGLLTSSHLHLLISATLVPSTNCSILMSFSIVSLAFFSCFELGMSDLSCRKSFRSDLPLAHLWVLLAYLLGVIFLFLEPLSVLRLFHDDLDAGAWVVQLVVDCVHELLSCVNGFSTIDATLIITENASSRIDAHLLHQSHLASRAVSAS